MKNTAKSKRDAAVIGTNDSSIVSKRSVERVYSASTAITQGEEYLRFVVKKPKRRSPLINRGYYVRMKAIRAVVSHHIANVASTPEKKIVIINLGCGYDTLPFEYINHLKNDGPSSDLSRRVYFVDVDFPELILKKAEMISDNPELLACLSQVGSDHSKNISLKSSEYITIGVDLHEPSVLEQFLSDNFTDDTELLFLSEVSIVYMETTAADNLIRWAASLKNSSFCLLEQIFPAGPEHPFAITMLSHFKKLGTPLNLEHRTLEAQVSRFEGCGWPCVDACDLLSVWDNLSADKRMNVEQSEPFDEDEELALFLQHYVLLRATRVQEANSLELRTHSPYPTMKGTQGYGRLFRPASFQKHSLLRRWYGAASTSDIPGTILYHGGTDGKRLDSTLALSSSHPTLSTKTKSSANLFATGTYPRPRLCHSLTKLADGSLFLAGGRTSPGNAVADCWLFRDGGWIRIHDLPHGGRYRHCAASLGGACSRIILFGGKGKNGVAAGQPWLVWSEADGWKKLEVFAADREEESGPCARWSASIACLHQRHPGVNEGMVSGGMNIEGILGDTWKWTIKEQACRIQLEKLSALSDNHSLTRFGAQMVAADHRAVVIVGGVSRDLRASYEEPILEINTEDGSIKSSKLQCRDVTAPKPLLVGFNCCENGNGRLAIFGGGAICFSFGSYWNSGIWTLEPTYTRPSDYDDKKDGSVPEWDIRQLAPAEVENSPMQGINTGCGTTSEQMNGDSTSATVPRVNLTSVSFEDLRRQEEPVLIENLNFGSCTSVWDQAYLKEKLDLQRNIIVHASKDEQNMNFQTKNFSYVTLPIGDFIDAAFSGTRHLYFRALSSKGATAAPASISDFPEICSDFNIPLELEFIRENEFSSPLRISSADIGMWLHYDVMSNCLFHCRGRKKLVLFPPGDIHPRLQFPPGQTTSVIENIFENVPEGTHPRFAIMEPGDVLFIPKFWAHAALPLTPCVAVNVFYRDMPLGVYSTEGKDVYGNKDIRAYEKARKSIRKIIEDFDEESAVPGNIRAFYLQRLGAELLAAVGLH